MLLSGYVTVTEISCEPTLVSSVGETVTLPVSGSTLIQSGVFSPAVYLVPAGASAALSFSSLKLGSTLSDLPCSTETPG